MTLKTSHAIRGPYLRRTKALRLGLTSLLWLLSGGFALAAETAQELPVRHSGSMSLGQFVYTSALTDAHINAIQIDPISFAENTLFPSIDSEELSNSSGLDWQSNNDESVPVTSPTGLAWVYVELVNNKNQDTELLVEASNFDGAGWFYADREGNTHVVLPGYDQYLGGRVIFDGDTIIPIRIPANERLQLFIMAYVISVPRRGYLDLWHPEDFREQRAGQHFVDGAFYGFLIFLVLYNLALSLMMRQVRYFYAGMFQLCVGILILLGSGYASIFLFPNNFLYVWPIYATVFMLLGCFGGLYSISLLRIKETHKTLYRLWLFIIVCVFAQIPFVIISIIPTEILPNSNLPLLIANISVALFSQLVHIYALFYYWNKSRIVKAMFLAVNLQFWLLVTWQLFGRLGAEHVDIFRYLAQLFTIFNGIVLTSLVGYEVRAAQRSHAAAQEEAMHNLKMANDIQASKASFINTAGHDLKQPLEAIRFHINSLQASTSKDTGQVLSKVESNVKELSSLLGSLMNFSRSTAQFDASSSEVFNLSVVLDVLEEELEPFALQKGLTLKVDKTDLYVRTNRVGLTQILRNILNNSLKYTKAGSISITLRETGGYIVMTIKDTGIGIPKDELSKIFTEFYRVDNGASESDSGMGLGLSIVKRLSEALGIAIYVDSTPGKGTSFDLELLKVSHPTLATPLKQYDPDSLEQLPIAILHDNPEMTEKFTSLIEQWGGNCLNWSDPSTAASYFKENHWFPALIIISESFYTQLIDNDSRSSSVEYSNVRDTTVDQQDNHSDLFRLDSCPMVIIGNNKGGSNSMTADPGNTKSNSRHLWIPDTINPGVLRSFIQRIVLNYSG